MVGSAIVANEPVANMGSRAIGTGPWSALDDVEFRLLSAGPCVGAASAPVGDIGSGPTAPALSSLGIFVLDAVLPTSSTPHTGHRKSVSITWFWQRAHSTEFIAPRERYLSGKQEKSHV